jgi:hypothetical protein
MPNSKVSVTYTVEQKHVTFLREIAERFNLPDESKTLRVLIEYARQDGDLYQIFGAENIRCHHPGNCPAFKVKKAKILQ